MKHMVVTLAPLVDRDRSNHRADGMYSSVGAPRNAAAAAAERASRKPVFAVDRYCVDYASVLLQHLAHFRVTQADYFIFTMRLHVIFNERYKLRHEKVVRPSVCQTPGL